MVVQSGVKLGVSCVNTYTRYNNRAYWVCEMVVGLVLGGSSMRLWGKEAYSGNGPAWEPPAAVVDQSSIGSMGERASVYEYIFLLWSKKTFKLRGQQGEVRTKPWTETCMVSLVWGEGKSPHTKQGQAVLYRSKIRLRQASRRLTAID